MRYALDVELGVRGLLFVQIGPEKVNHVFVTDFFGPGDERPPALRERNAPLVRSAGLGDQLVL